jgi:hypothetical protein
MLNPFFFGNPVSPDQFTNRTRDVRRVVSRLRQRGQSTAIIGEPKSGKTSLLQYLAAPQNTADLYGEAGGRLLFSFVDLQLLGGQVTPALFWELALAPVRAVLGGADTPLGRQFALCGQNQYGAIVLEGLFRQLSSEGWTLALLLDEFDTLLHHPILNSAEFFGGLRSLASRSQGALAIVIASRISLVDMEGRTREIKPIGSPYFNIFSSVVLGGFPPKDAAKMLGQAGEAFSLNDRSFIQRVAGGHPYLLQAAGWLMWEAYQENLDDPVARYQQVSRRLQEETRLHFSDSWHSWTPAQRKALTAIALAHAGHLLAGREFNVRRLVADLRDWTPEIADLQARGLAAETDALASGWKVEPYALLWWLADELVRQVRADTPFEQWVRAQEMTGPGGLTSGQMERMGEAAQAVAAALGRGASTLIESLAKGYGEGAGKALLP